MDIMKMRFGLRLSFEEGTYPEIFFRLRETIKVRFFSVDRRWEFY